MDSPVLAGDYFKTSRKTLFTRTVMPQWGPS